MRIAWEKKFREAAKAKGYVVKRWNGNPPVYCVNKDRSPLVIIRRVRGTQDWEGVYMAGMWPGEEFCQVVGITSRTA